VKERYTNYHNPSRNNNNTREQ